MSRLLRKGAAIGKAVLVVVVAGLLLYGAAKVVNAEWGVSTKGTVEKTPDIYLAEAQAALTAGNVAAAYETAVQMINSVPACEATGEAASQIGRKVAAAGDAARAMEILLYAVEHATGEPLKKALCGLVDADALKGDGKAACAAVSRLSEEFAGDASAGRVANRLAEKYLRQGAEGKACKIYGLVAEKWTGTDEGMAALSGLGRASNSTGEYGDAAQAVVRLLSEYPADHERNRLALEIGHKLAQFQQFDRAEGIYRKIETDNPDREDIAGIAVGRIVIAINQSRFEDAASLLDELGKSDLPNAGACVEIGNAYFDRGRFAEGGEVFRTMVELAPKPEVARKWQGKVVRCAILGGDDAAAIAATRKLVVGYPGVKGSGEALFDAVITCVRGNRPDLGSDLIAKCADTLSEHEDLMWADAAMLGLAIASDPAADGKYLADDFMAKWGPGRKETIGAVFEIGRLCSTMAVSEMRNRQSDKWKGTILRAQGVFRAILDQSPDSKYAPESCWRSATYFDMLNNAEKAVEYAERLVATCPQSEFAPKAYQMLLREYRDRARRTPDAENVQKAMATSQMIMDKFPEDKRLVEMAASELEHWTNAIEKGGVK